jgi:hypothetical protein
MITFTWGYDGTERNPLGLSMNIFYLFFFAVFVVDPDPGAKKMNEIIK